MDRSQSPGQSKTSLPNTDEMKRGGGNPHNISAQFKNNEEKKHTRAKEA